MNTKENARAMKTDRKALVSFCTSLAANLDTGLDVRDYDEYGWTGIAFETDAFGGTYAHIHFDHTTGVATNWYGRPDAVRIESFVHLAAIVKAALAEALRTRDFGAISEMLADQY
jgi:hypothetical protein